MEESVIQVVVPKPFQEWAMKVAYGEIAGNLGVNKTYDRILRQFYWPNLTLLLLLKLVIYAS